jgi:hypothetical protein
MVEGRWLMVEGGTMNRGYLFLIGYSPSTFILNLRRLGDV